MITPDVRISVTISWKIVFLNSNDVCIGIRTVRYVDSSVQTIRYGQFGTRQFGTWTIRYADNSVRGQLGTRTIRYVVYCTESDLVLLALVVAQPQFRNTPVHHGMKQKREQVRI